MKKTLLWSVMTLVALSSCQDEFIKNNENKSDKISYKVETFTMSAPLKIGNSRSAETSNVSIEALGQTLGGKPLYLHTITDCVMPMDIKEDKETGDKHAQSRGTESSTTSIKTAGSTIGVSAIVWNGTSWEDTGTERKLFMDNVTAEAEDFSTNYYWPAAQQRIRFFAYHPQGSTSISTTDKKNLTIEWEVHSTVADQKDLLVASADYAGDYKQKAPLFFGHALTAVQFQLDENITGVTVTGVRIKGVKYKGTYTYNYCGHNSDDGNDATPDTDNGTWVVDDDIYAGDEGKGFEITGLEKTSGIINDGANTFMMIPQTLPNEATIEVDVEDSNNPTPVILSAPIGNTIWQKGTKVIYKVSFDTNSTKYVLKVSDGSGNFAEELTVGTPFPYYGGFGNYSIRSYKITTELGKEPKYEAIKWAVTSTSGVDYVSNPSGAGVTSESASEGTYKFGMLPGELTSTSHAEFAGIKANASVLGTYENPVDLSTHEPDYLNVIPRHTANCYVVRYPGYYKLPIVYGNAIKDGDDNPSAYTSTHGETNWPFSADRYVCTNESGKALITAKDGTNKGEIEVSTLGEFRDHAHGEENFVEGNAIKGPWIADQANHHSGINYTPTSVEIVWQDAPCLLSDVRLEQYDEGGKKRDFIVFNIDEDIICDGNAVVAVKNASGHIMWSWHIWVSWSGTINSKTITNRRVLGNYSSTDYKTGDVYNTTCATNWTREESDFELFPRMLGMCYGENKSYAERKGSIIFQQVDDEENVILGGAEAVLNFTVGSASIDVGNSAPTYQWGRKDPILPASGNTSPGSYSNNKTWYGKDRTPHVGENIPITSNLGTKNIAVTIQNPGVFFMDSGSKTDKYVTTRNWCSTNYINLWNANCNELPMFSYHQDVDEAEYHNYYNKLVSIPVVKTVYDPCPPGWEMPRIDAFTGLTLTGTRAKPYFRYSADPQIFNAYYNANVGWHGNYTGDYGSVYELAVYRKPMLGPFNVVGYTDNASTNPDLYWMLGLGMRRNTGESEYYATWGTMLTNAVTCVQSILEDGEHSGKYPEFEYKSSRLCFIYGGDVFTGADGDGYGTIRPFSFSNVDMSFGVIPVRTGCNPAKTEVLTSGQINPWGNNTGDDVEVKF